MERAEHLAGYRHESAGETDHDLTRQHGGEPLAERMILHKPGAYPWRNHPNAWRAAHIHLSPG